MDVKHGPIQVPCTDVPRLALLHCTPTGRASPTPHPASSSLPSALNITLILAQMLTLALTLHPHRHPPHPTTLASHLSPDHPHLQPFLDLLPCPFALHHYLFILSSSQIWCRSTNQRAIMCRHPGSRPRAMQNASLVRHAR